MDTLVSSPEWRQAPKSPEFGLTLEEELAFKAEYFDDSVMPDGVVSPLVNPDPNWFRKAPDVVMYGTLMSADPRELEQGYMSGVVDSSEHVSIPGAGIGTFYPDNHRGYKARTGDTDEGPWPYIVGKETIRAMGLAIPSDSVQAELFHLKFATKAEFIDWTKKVKEYEVVEGNLYTWQVIAVVRPDGSRVSAMAFIPSFQQEPLAHEILPHGNWLRFRDETSQ